MFKYVNLIVICVCLLSAIGCGPTLKFTTETYATLDPSTKAKQEIDNISIEMNVLPDIEYDKSFYMQPIDVGLGAEAQKIYYFNKSTCFTVTIINNTNHILRMRDSRIIFVEPNSDEPKMALDKEEILKDIESQLPSYQAELGRYSNHLTENTMVTMKISEQLKTAMINITKKLDFVNGFNREIMPGMRLKGIIMFPIENKSVAQGKVSFVDMVSETDAAGNPTKKVRFDYRIAVTDKFFRYNSATDKGYVEIKKEEYDARPNK
jgi:hypothetical protein